MTGFRILPGLPPYGPMAETFPPEAARRGIEGFVVEFEHENARWVGNFVGGWGGFTGVLAHPNGAAWLVVTGGDLWYVDPRTRQAEPAGSGVQAAWPVSEPEGYVFDRSGVAFCRIDAGGLRWQTRRLSWDGFRNVTLGVDTLRGEAYTPVDAEQMWHPFEVTLHTGESTGGAFAFYDDPTLPFEHLAPEDGAA